MKLLYISYFLLTFSLLPISAQLMSVDPNNLAASNEEAASSPLKEALSQDIDGLMSKVIKWICFASNHVFNSFYCCRFF